MNNYQDIINLEHKEPTNHKRMSMENRAAQFAPFAALTGYEEQVEETGRETTSEIEINDDLKDYLDQKIQIINYHLKEEPQVQITYFIKDNKKEGGEYKTNLFNIKRIDNINNILITTNKELINIKDIIRIEGEIFNE